MRGIGRRRKIFIESVVSFMFVHMCTHWIVFFGRYAVQSKGPAIVGQYLPA